MRRIAIGLLLLFLLGLTGCSLTREPKPPRPPEELRPPPDEARYQSPNNIYPNNVLNQDTNAKSRDANDKNGSPAQRRAMNGPPAGMSGAGMGGGGMPGSSPY
jgi:hypothetical protein